MERKEDGTMELSFSGSEKRSPVDEVIEEINEKYGIQEEVSLYSILKVGFQMWVKEQVENSGGKLSGSEWDEWDGKDKVDNWRKKFEHRLEQILYEGVVDNLKTSDKKAIMLPKEAKESVLFLVGLGDARKKYQEELEQLIKGKTIPNDALNYISRMIQLIFSKKNGVVLNIQGYINIKGSSQTKEMISKSKEFFKIFANTAAKVAAITDISAYDRIYSAMDKCEEIMRDVLMDWCMDDRELPNYDSWIRQNLRKAINDDSLFSVENWKENTNTFLDALDTIDIEE